MAKHAIDGIEYSRARWSNFRSVVQPKIAYHDPLGANDKILEIIQENFEFPMNLI